MTADDVRRLALAFPGAVEAFHLHQPNYRLEGRIFASVGSPDFDSGIVKLTLEQQRGFVDRNDGVFRPASGTLGRSGYTIVRLSSLTEDELRDILEKSVHNVLDRSPVAST